MTERPVDTGDARHDKRIDSGHPAAHPSHNHVPAFFSTAFAIGTALNLTFVLVELVYRLKAQSLALVTDVGNNLSYVLGLLLVL